MAIIDDQGNLFGVVNVVDALVVLLVLAVAIAGATFVLADEPEPVPDPEPDVETRFATLDLGTLSPQVAALVQADHNYSPSADSSLTVTDVYSTDAGDDRRVLVRVELTGELSDDTLVYDDEPPRIGRELELVTDEYRVSGEILAVEADDPTLPIAETDVLLRTTLPSDTAESISVGDEYRVGDRTVATIESVEATATGDGRALAFVGVTYHTYAPGDSTRFGDTAVREGATLPFSKPAYSFEGEVVRTNALEQRGEPATRTVTLTIDSTDRSFADALSAGMTEQLRGETIASLSDVEVMPATVVVTDEAGELHLREHPEDVDVTLTVELAVRETPSGVLFKGELLRYGEHVVLDLETITVRATVTGVH